MKVTFLLRSDAASKPGGDSSKVYRYAERLGELGVSTEIIYNRSELARTRPDLVHLVNLDLPLENLANAYAAKALGLPVVLSTIRHPIRGIEQMYRWGEDRLYRQLRRASIPVWSGVASREVLKLVRRRDLDALRRIRSYVSAQERLLANSDLVLTMAPSEGADLTASFGSCELVDIPNGLSFETHRRRAGGTFEFDFVNIGRIEPRKNSLELVRAAAQTDFRMIIIGKVNENHPAYVKAFMREVSAAPRITYGGEVAHDDVKRTLDSADIYINPAWFEVVSQADFEAASRGARVATTVNSYVNDFLTEGLLRFDPIEIVQDGPALLERLGESATVPTPPEPRTWRAVGDELMAAYATILPVS